MTFWKDGASYFTERPSIWGCLILHEIRITHRWEERPRRDTVFLTHPIRWQVTAICSYVGDDANFECQVLDMSSNFTVNLLFSCVITNLCRDNIKLYDYPVPYSVLMALARIKLLE